MLRSRWIAPEVSFPSGFRNSLKKASDVSENTTAAYQSYTVADRAGVSERKRSLKKKQNLSSTVYAETASRTPGAPPDLADRPFHELRKAVHNGLAIISLRRWLFFFPFCIVAAATFITSLNYPRTYTATTRFERRDDPILIDLPTTEGIGSFAYFRQTLERDIVAPAAMTKAVIKLGLIDQSDRGPDGELSPDARARAEALGRSLIGSISVSSKERTQHLDLVEIRYTGPDPDLGVKLVDALRSIYVEDTRTRIREVLEGKKTWYTKRLDDATAHLTATQKQLSLLRLENPYIDPHNPSTVADRLEDLQRERRDLELRLKTAAIDMSGLQELYRSTQMRIAVGARDGAEPGPGLLFSAEAVRIATAIKSIDDQIEKLKLERGMLDKHPEIVQLRAERARLEERLFTQRRADDQVASNQPIETADPQLVEHDDPILIQWRQENDRIKNQIDTLEQHTREFETRLAATIEKIDKLTVAKDRVLDQQETFARLIGEIDLATAECNGYRDVLGRIEPILAANEQGRAVTFTEEQAARGSHVPVSPQTRTIMIVALLLGCSAGIAFVILAEVIDHVFRNSQQVARSVGLTILETIDVIVTSADRRRSLIRRVVLAPAAITLGLSLLIASAGIAYLSVEHPNRYESLRKLPDTLLDRLAESNLFPHPSRGAADRGDKAAALADSRG